MQGSSQSAACKATPQRGGTLVYARQQTTENLDTLKLVNGNGDIFASNLLFNGLVRPDPKGTTTVQGAVADKWEVSGDGKTYTFHIRPGIKFSDGSPITADDVKFSLDRFGDPKINQTLAAVAVGYGSTKVVDKSTVKVQLQFPVASFLFNISIFPAFIVPKKLVQQQGAAFWKHPVGSGPFEFKELKRGSHITFVRNPNYWDAGKPYLDTVRFDFATDSNSRLLSLRDGQAQIADGVPFSQVNELKDSKDLTLQTAQVPLFVGLWFNHKRPAARRSPGPAGDAVRDRPQGDQPRDLPRGRHDPQQPAARAQVRRAGRPGQALRARHGEGEVADRPVAVRQGLRHQPRLPGGL